MPVASSIPSATLAFVLPEVSSAKEPVADYAKRVGLPATETIDLGNGVEAAMVLIPAGRFVMGTPKPVAPDWNGQVALV